MGKKFVLDLNLPDWEAYVKEKGFPKFRAAQIYSWYSKGVLDMDKMSNVPGNIKSALREDFVCDSMSIEKHRQAVRWDAVSAPLHMQDSEGRSQEVRCWVRCCLPVLLQEKGSIVSLSWVSESPSTTMRN